MRKRRAAAALLEVAVDGDDAIGVGGVDAEAAPAPSSVRATLLKHHFLPTTSMWNATGTGTPRASVAAGGAHVDACVTFTSTFGVVRGGLGFELVHHVRRARLRRAVGERDRVREVLARRAR